MPRTAFSISILMPEKNKCVNFIFIVEYETTTQINDKLKNVLKDGTETFWINLSHTRRLRDYEEVEFENRQDGARQRIRIRSGIEWNLRYVRRAGGQPQVQRAHRRPRRGQGGRHRPTPCCLQLGSRSHQLGKPLKEIISPFPYRNVSSKIDIGTQPCVANMRAGCSHISTD